MFSATNPYTGQKLKSYPTCNSSELEAAIERAHQACSSYERRLSVVERARCLNMVAELYSERRETLAAITQTEVGKPISQARAEIDFCAEIYRYYAAIEPSFFDDQPIPLSSGDGTAFLRREPLGVILGIMPWNYPHYQVARFAAPNLLIGNSVILKHAPICPQSADLISLLLRDAGFGALFTNVFASESQIEMMTSHPLVRGVSFTGSAAAGSIVASVAGRNLKKVTLELGGSDPFIVLSTADMDETVEAAVGARLENAGQACTAAKRFIVVDELYEEFLGKFAAAMSAIQPGDPAVEDTELGPLSSARAAERLENQVRRAVAQGATLVTGGVRKECLFEPTILTDITPANSAYREEFFGPVACVYRAYSEADAVRIANDTPFGLGANVITVDQQQGMRVASRLEAGMVFVNSVGCESVELPFGGVKGSGFGRELGRLGLDEFVNKKVVRLG